MNLSQFIANKRLSISLAVLLFLAGGILATTYLAGKPQLIQKEAAGEKVVLSLSPKKAGYTKGEEFDVEILLDTNDKPVVGVDVSLSFDKEKLQAKSVTPGSLFEDQIEFKNEIVEDKILLSLGSLIPFTGTGTYATIYFQAVKVGEAAVTFNQKPEIKVAQEGGGDILGQTINGSYTISEQEPTSTPTLTPTPTISLTPIPTVDCPEQAKKGDYNCNGEINEQDFEAWKKDYLDKNTTLPFFEYWRRAFFSE